MDSHSFVAPEGSGYVTYLANERLGWHEFQSEAEQHYINTISSRYSYNSQACVRAREFARLRSHVRPDGTSFFSILPKEVQPSAWEVGVWWSESERANLSDAISLWLNNRDINGNYTHRQILLYNVSELGVCVTDGAAIALGIL